MQFAAWGFYFYRGSAFFLSWAIFGFLDDAVFSGGGVFLFRAIFGEIGMHIFRGWVLCFSGLFLVVAVVLFIARGLFFMQHQLGSYFEHWRLFLAGLHMSFLGYFGQIHLRLFLMQIFILGFFEGELSIYSFFLLFPLWFFLFAYT